MGVFLESLGFGLAIAFMVVGLIGVVVPIIPGVLLVWLTAVIYAFLTDFSHHSVLFVVLFSLLALVIWLGEIWLPMLGAARTGASRRGMVLGGIGAIVGLIVASLPGAIIGYALGIVAGEYQKRRDWRQALKASVGGLAGWGAATILQLVGAAALIILFAWPVLAG